ncbi:MAG: hypothetical protein IKW89_02645 [Bacteroidales bacterium]|nr:hypothetical protein [Bacteroidales bacterium]
MEQKGLTKKQFWIQLTPVIFYTPLAVIWMIEGIRMHRVLILIASIAYFVLIIWMVVSLIIRRKRYPIEDEESDRQAVGAFKDGAMGMGIVMAIITVGFLLAFGLATLLK